MLNLIPKIKAKALIGLVVAGIGVGGFLLIKHRLDAAWAAEQQNGELRSANASLRAALDSEVSHRMELEAAQRALIARQAQESAALKKTILELSNEPQTVCDLEPVPDSTLRLLDQAADRSRHPHR